MVDFVAKVVDYKRAYTVQVHNEVEDMFGLSDRKTEFGNIGMTKAT